MGRLVTPSRIQLARRLRGYSQIKVASETELSAAAISQFESGAASPSTETLERLAVVLKVSPAFFSRHDIAPHAKPFFRSVSRVPAGERDRAHAYSIVVADIVAELERLLEVPPLRIGQLAAPRADSPLELIEALAETARRQWGISEGPIADVVAASEARGVVVTAVGSFHEGIDAFTSPTRHRPIVVLCSGKGVATRRRFDMAHELAHLALHNERSATPKWQEKQANRWASAFLMPADLVSSQMPRRGDDLRGFEGVARTWGVSMQAAMVRARDLGMISQDEFTRGMKRMTSAGWRRNEPLEIGPPERPILLRAAARALPDAGTSLKSLADLLGFPLERLKRMLSLPEERDDASFGNVVSLRP